ncbi:hypothetical protein Tco_1528468 [Tanacetum coccineum]
MYSTEACNNVSYYCISVFGRRLGRSMRVVADAVKAMSQPGKCLQDRPLLFIKAVREFKRHSGVTEEEMDASSDGWET